MRTPSRPSSGIGWAIVLIAVLVIGSLGFTIASATHVETKTCTVIGKDRTTRTDKDGNNKSDARVYTEDCGTLRVEDSLRAPGWSFCQPEGPHDTSAEWSNETLSLSGMPYLTALTEMTYHRQGGAEAPPIKALVTFLADAKRPNKRLALITVHMSLDNTPLRAEVWRDCGKGMKALIKRIRAEDPGIEVVVASDFNKNYREEKERAAIERYFCKPNGLRQAWDGWDDKAKGGTHGPRSLIDGWLVSEGIKVRSVRLLADTDSSDHRPLTMRISF